MILRWNSLQEWNLLIGYNVRRNSVRWGRCRVAVVLAVFLLVTVVQVVVSRLVVVAVVVVISVVDITLVLQR